MTMKSARPRPRISISLMRFVVIWFSALTAVTVVVVAVPVSGWLLGAVRAQSSPMEGGWVGTCRDGRSFVMLLLRPVESGYGGRISIGNMTVTSRPAAAVGECTVKDAATPEHSVNITKGVVANGVLTIGSENGQEVEMKMTGGDTAELRFVGTAWDASWFGLERVK